MLDDVYASSSLTDFQLGLEIEVEAAGYDLECSLEFEEDSNDVRNISLWIESGGLYAHAFVAESQDVRLNEMVSLRMRHRNTHGTFGCKITTHQLNQIFYSEQRFFRIYEPTATIFLIRENILEQAVSLSRKMQTGVGHSTSGRGSEYNSVDFLYIPGSVNETCFSKLHS